MCFFVACLESNEIIISSYVCILFGPQQKERNMNIHLTLLIPLKLVDFPNNFICWSSKGLCSFSFLSFRALSKDCFEHELCWQDGCADPLYVFNWDSTKAPSGGIRHAEKYTNFVHSEWKWFFFSNSPSVSSWNQNLFFENVLKTGKVQVQMHS